MREYFGVVVATVALVLTGFVATPAEAVRPCHDNTQKCQRALTKDRCRNIPGKQGIFSLLYGYWEYNTDTRRPNDCRPGWRSDVRGM